MKLLKYLLPFAMAACGITATINAAEFSTVQEARERDDQAVTDFVKSKRAISLQEKGGALMISGTVQAEWDYMHCWSDHHRQRGSGSANIGPTEKPHAPFPTSEFTIETNLMLDYKTDRSWAAVQLQFNNSAGVNKVDHKKPQTNDKNILWGSGSADNLFMRKAYIGYNLAERGASRWDVEIGRRRLYDVFDSQVQFYSIFDGLTLKYANSFEGAMDLSVKAAAFVIDQTVNQFGYVGEVGLLNIGETGLDLKYSVIDWDTHEGRNRFGHKHARGSQFLNQQVTFGYNFSPDMMACKTKLYGAYLHNSAAKRNRYSNDMKKDDAYYVGVRFGEIMRAGDWSLDLQYQLVEAQAVPEFDVSGIKRDNPQNVSFYNHRWGGFANYQGYKLNGNYAMTDNWTWNVSFERARQESHKIGGKHRSYQFEVAAIYAF